MIHKLLIANRGEIAVRVIRTCREMGIATVAVYSQADAESLGVKMADERICIGPPPSKDSYLNVTNIISAAALTQCDAIHPGVGFLSENADFAEKVRKAGITFIGADPHVIRAMGDKVNARQTALDNDLPVIPGSAGAVASTAEALKAAEKIGFPVILKAAAGGGGRGMRIVRTPKEMSDSLKIAGAEAESFFSDGTIYMEKYLETPRHVEIQVVSDSHGQVVALGERDCSVQKDHQKLLEESPSTATNDDLRARMQADAVRLFKNLGYSGAGTIEFLVQDGAYYFMEVNARVQVEHPVSEIRSGIDIIRQQILAASGQPLDFDPEKLRLIGYSLECRVNALTPGKITAFMPPNGPGVRTDTHLYPGYVVPPYYDSLVVKLIVHAETRSKGITRMIRVLDEMELEGIVTNKSTQMEILKSRPFRSGKFDVSLYGRLFKD